MDLRSAGHERLEVDEGDLRPAVDLRLLMLLIMMMIIIIITIHFYWKRCPPRFDCKIEVTKVT